MNTIKALCLALSLSLWAGTSTADERFLPLIDWLTANSEFEYNGEPLPTIKYLPYAYLEVEVYGAETVARAEHQGMQLSPIKGAYLHLTNTMLFPDDFDWETGTDVVVHELVHFLQNVAGEDPDCIQTLERPAYTLHWEWVKAHGLEAMYQEPNWLFVFMLEMACYDMHPDHAR